ncbi:MAG: FMN-binding negative transcriptional regulator [Alphaproteobacteria bacterium]
MHQPPLFREERVEILHDLIARHPFATLVAAGDGGIEASHLPMLLSPEPAPLGSLIGHLARANPMLADGRDSLHALAVFQGPQAYVSPSWYPSKRAHGRVVPTWNYVAVHAHGTLARIDDPARLRDIVERLTAARERRFAAPWSVDDAPADFVAGMLKGIVGLELRIERLDGNWKLSQNRAPDDRRGVIAALEASDDPADRAVAAAMVARDGD